ncbi:MAG TPA: hypothetical protein VFQ74_09300 [Pseudolysinimonas sp.]|nr:hypothetical protein [Pseudolysinimonas sp.]
MNVTTSQPGTSTRLRIAAGLVLLVQAVALVVVLLTHGTSLLLPVITTAGSASFTVTTVNVAVGAIVPVALGALAFLTSTAVDRRARWIESSLSSSITVFLIAELNGIRELAALVAIYALTSAAVLFAVVQQGRTTRPRMLPASFGAAVGIVPWGLIAWYEIAPVVAGMTGPAAWVRVMTVVVLALFVSAAVLVWRGMGGSRAAAILRVVTRSAVAWGVVSAVLLL